MKRIKDLVDNIGDELNDAKMYAESYLDAKANGDQEHTQHYMEMSKDELKHSGYLHEIAVQEINKLREVYTPPQEMIDVWEKSHKEYIEKAAWIKQMLTL